MKVNLTIVYTAGSKNISLGHQTRFHSPKEQGKMKWLERRRDESKGNEMSEIATRLLTSMGILYGHIFHDEFPKNLKKYVVCIILILQKCQRKL